MSLISRRQFHASVSDMAASPLLRHPLRADDTEPFSLKYILDSCLYGYQYVGEILSEVRKTGALAIDIWTKVHGNQREQLTDLDEKKFAAMRLQWRLTERRGLCRCLVEILTRILAPPSERL